MQVAQRHPVVEEFARLAPSYDRRWRRYVDRSIRETLSRLSATPAESLLDVGCGTGAMLAALARAWPDARLAGVDPAAEMLQVARSKLPPTVSLHQAYAEKLPFENGSFELVASTSAFHFFSDPSAALAEMHRVLAPRGRVVITDWCDDYLTCRLCSAALRWLGRSRSPTFRAQECTGLLQSAGFQDVRVERYKITWLWGMMTVTAFRDGEREQPAAVT